MRAIARCKLVDMLRSRATSEALTDPLDDELEVFAAFDTDAADARNDLGQLLAGLPVVVAAQLTGMPV